MAEENQVQQEPQQVTTKNPKKVEAGKRLAAHNCRQRKKKREEVQKGELNQYYGIGAVLAVWVIGCLGYYIYRVKKGQATVGWNREVPNSPPPKPNKFEMN